LIICWRAQCSSVGPSHPEALWSKCASATPKLSESSRRTMDAAFTGSAHGRVVVRRTFVEVLDDDALAGGSCAVPRRRAWSDSAFCGLAAGRAGLEPEDVGLAPRHSKASGGVRARPCCAVAAHPASSADSPGATEDWECTSSSVVAAHDGEPVWSESFDSALEHGASMATPSGCLLQAHSLASARHDVDLFSENARLCAENRLLWERASALGQGGESASQPCASVPPAIPSESFTSDSMKRVPSGLCRKESGASCEPHSEELQKPVKARTTVMLRNVPNNYTREMLMSMLDDEGFSACYDFVYLPVDFNSGACLGYAFVNLAEAGHVEPFWRAFDGYARWAMPSRKVCRVSWCGPHQGLEAHIARYRNSPVMHDTVPEEYKPILLSQGRRVAFPGPSRAPRAPRIRHRGDGVRRQRVGC